MELTELKNRLISCFRGDENELSYILSMIEQDRSVYPFNQYEHMICAFIDRNNITYQEYQDIRDEYIAQNPNLWIFEISAPRTFGEDFAQNHITSKSRLIQRASKRLDPNYSGQYDLWLDGIKIEVKASRAVDAESKEPLYIKALSSDTQKSFLMNFQQLKPQYCDVFIWLAVFRDAIRIWIINSNTVINHPLYSQGQHRGNLGNEGQLHITKTTIHLFDEFELLGDDIINAIKTAYQSNPRP